MTSPPDLLDRWLESRLAGAALDFAARAREECAGAPSSRRFGELVALSSRHARGPLAPTEVERREAAEALAGWDPERWSLLETLRARLAIGLACAGGEAADATLEEAFRFADEGETCALMRAAALLPRPDRFRWRVGEGCRSNMRTVFEAAACDTPYMALHFDREAFHQAAIKALFVGAPLWRVVGLDERIDPTLARMALDLADERRSAGRHVPHELWLCLGDAGGKRGDEALTSELEASRGAQPDSAPADHAPRARVAVGIAFARAGRRERTAELAANEPDPRAARLLRVVLDGAPVRRVFRHLEPDAFSAVSA